MMHAKIKEKDSEKEIINFEKKVAWYLLLVFIVSGILAYQVIFNVIFADVLYNPALGDIAVKTGFIQTDDAGDEPKVEIWREKKNAVLRSNEGIPTMMGIQIPQFYFICIMVALGLVLFNIRSCLLKRFIQSLEGESLQKR